MSTPLDLTFDADDFSGVARLFPLPNLVMFPRVMQPLHIFEPRYRDLFEDALASDQLIALAVLSPGWESDYDGRPAIESIACLGKIVTVQKMPDGRMNALVVGLKRVAVKREHSTMKLYREADVAVREDEYPTITAASRPQLRRRLLQAFQAVVSNLPEIEQQIVASLGDDLPLGPLTDIIAYALQMDWVNKLALLHESNVDRRADLLLQQLSETPKLEIQPDFPPPFSDN